MSETEQTKLEVTEGSKGEAEMVGGGFTKPVFTKMTPALIQEVKWFKHAEAKKDNHDNEFIGAYLQVHFQAEGISELVVENYGFRIYKNKDGTLRAYYGGKDSICGGLRKMTESTFELSEQASLDEFISVLKGKTALLKTGETVFGAKKFQKQIVQQFRV